MTASERRRLSREDRRAQLIDIGRREVERTSFDGLSTDDVAARAGISRGLLFHYFPTRDDFLVALAEDAADELLERTAPDDSLETVARLRAGLRAYVEFVTEHEDMYVALIRGAAGGGVRMLEVFERTREVQAERILAGLGFEPGDAPPLVQHAARGYVAFVEEVVVAWLDGDGDSSLDGILDFLERAGVAIVTATGIDVPAR